MRTLMKLIDWFFNLIDSRKLTRVEKVIPFPENMSNWEYSKWDRDPGQISLLSSEETEILRRAQQKSPAPLTYLQCSNLINAHRSMQFKRKIRQFKSK